MQLPTYDQTAFARASHIGWLEYARIYGKYVMGAGNHFKCVQLDATQSTKMCLWHLEIRREMGL